MKQMSSFKIVITALFAALICVATMLIQIPIPATGGYANLGDGIILICAFLMPPAYAVMAAVSVLHWRTFWPVTFPTLRQRW